MRKISLLTIWIFWFLISSALPGALFAHPKNKNEKKNNRQDILILKNGLSYRGKLLEVRDNGVVFDPAPISPFSNPKPAFYKFSDIRKLILGNGKLVCTPPPIPKPHYVRAVSVLANRLKSGNSTFLPILVQVNAVSKQSEITAIFGKSFNQDEGVGCCECTEEIPPYHYRFRYSTYFWQIGGKLRLEHSGIELGLIGGRAEGGWCNEDKIFIPGLPYIGAWEQITPHLSIGANLLVTSYGVFKAGATWRFNNRLSNAWVGVLYSGDRIPRWPELRPSFRLQIQVQKNWLLHLRLYQVNGFFSSEPQKWLLFGIGWVLNPD